MSLVYRFGRFELRPGSRELLIDGKTADLRSRALDVLLALAERHDRIVTKDELLALAWPGLVVEENNLAVQVSALRKILGEGSIRTIAGRGYQFAYDITQSGGTQTGPQARQTHGFPQVLTRFIGREADLTHYEDILEENRLVTLTGAGGVGKTRLATELATRVASKFAHGTWFVDLAPVADPSRVPLTTALAFGLSEQPGQSIIDTLREHLCDLEILLLLDNCEQLLCACAALAQDLLGSAPRLKVLATSREGLGVPGEQTLTLRSLSFPRLGEGNGPASFEGFESVRLFVDRARLVQARFSLDESTATAVGEICRRLDGIPLAIELAAARTRILSIDELRQKLDDRFSLLVGGSTATFPRQQTLRAMIKWSVDLLAPEERQLLQRLSVFSGGCTLDGALAVEGSANEYDVLDRLTHLLDKSLITVQPVKAGPTRYAMLETVRQYAAEGLAEAGGADTIARRHLQHFVELAEPLRPAFFGEQRKAALDRLTPELENIVQALSQHDESDLSGARLRLAATLDQYWLSLGLLKLGYRLTTEALMRHPAENACAARVSALCMATGFATWLGRYEEARVWGEQGLALARTLHDEPLTARALSQLAGVACQLEDDGSAIAYGEESLSVARRQGDEEHIRRALYNLGLVHLTSGNSDRARQLFEECLQLGRGDRDLNTITRAAGGLALIYIARGDLRKGWALQVESVEASSASADTFLMFQSLDGVIGLAAAKLEWRRAARMLGAAEALSNMLGYQRTRPDGSFLQPIASAIRSAQSEADFKAAFEAGGALTLEQAIGEARAWLGDGRPNA